MRPGTTTASSRRAEPEAEAETGCGESGHERGVVKAPWDETDACRVTLGGGDARAPFYDDTFVEAG